MGTVGGAIFVAVLLLVVAVDILGDTLTQGIGLRVLRKASTGRWPPEPATWQQRVLGAVVGWLVVLSFLALVYVGTKLLA